jgi:hypothetical protein
MRRVHAEDNRSQVPRANRGATVAGDDGKDVTRPLSHLIACSLLSAYVTAALLPREEEHELEEQGKPELRASRARYAVLCEHLIALHDSHLIACVHLSTVFPDGVVSVSLILPLNLPFSSSLLTRALRVHVR